MLNENMKKLLSGSSMIRKMFEEGQEMAARIGKENVYDFSLGNPASPVPKEVRESIDRNLDEKDSNYVHGYMKNAGFDEARQKIADYLNQSFGMKYSKDSILMTVGAAGAMNCVFRSILEKDDEVIVFAPFFGEYRNYAGNYGGKLVVLPAKTDDFQLNLEALDSAITERTKAIIVNNPNNPSGAIYSAETLKKLRDILKKAEQRIKHPILVLADEPYRRLAYDGSTVPFIPNIIRNTVFIYSFSKTISLPGERIGFLAVGPEVEDAEELMNAFVTANRCLGFVNAPSLFQLVAADCISIPADLEFYDHNRRRLYETLTEYGFNCVKPEGAFYLFVKSPIEDETAFVEEAKKYHILMVPAASFGCPGYVRIAYCVDPAMIERSLPAFQKLAEEYGLK